MADRPLVVLVAPGSRRRPKYGVIVRLPLAILSLAAWLREHSEVEIALWDMNVDPQPPESLRRAKVVGVSAMTGQQVHYGLKACEHVRAVNPSALIVWGGIHASLLPEETARDNLADVVVRGEGEETFTQLLQAVVEGGAVEGTPGTYVKSNEGRVVKGTPRSLVDMERLPLPAYDLLHLSCYPGVEGQFDYQSSRGCPFRCDFCYNNAFCGSKWRAKSAEKVVDELAHLRERHGVRCFALVDDEFFINRKRVEAIVEGLLSRVGGIQLTASCRLDVARKFPEELLDKMRRAGFRNMYFGAESGSDSMLRRMNKGTTTEDVYEGARNVSRAGIRPILSFMSGFPGETREDFDQTLQLIDRIRQNVPLAVVNGIFPYSPYPGTKMYEEAVREGLKSPQSLGEWGAWNFQYTPSNPWLDRRKRIDMQIVFYIVRFWYYLAMYRDRGGGSPVVSFAVQVLSLPLRLSAKIRWGRRWFGGALEWRLFGYLAKRSFGYM